MQVNLVGSVDVHAIHSGRPDAVMHLCDGCEVEIMTKSAEYWQGFFERHIDELLGHFVGEQLGCFIITGRRKSGCAVGEGSKAIVLLEELGPYFYFEAFV